MFWGGLWGAVLAATLARLDGARLVLASLVFGAIFRLGTGFGLALFGRSGPVRR